MMLIKNTSQPSRMWSSSLHLTLAAVTCLLLASSIFTTRLPELFVPNAIAVVLLCLCVLIMWANRQKRPETLAAMVYFFTTIVVIVDVFINHEVYVGQDLPFMPFIGIKVLCVALALTAPPKRWLGWSSFALCAIVPVIQYFSWAPELRSKVAVQEPWITVMFAIAGAFLYVHRSRVYELLRKEEQAEALRKYSHLLLASQHLLNTPLQVIELSTSLITRSEEDRKKALENIEKSMSTIRHLNQLLSFGESNIKWNDLRLPGSIEEFERNVNEFKEEMKPQQKPSLERP